MIGSYFWSCWICDAVTAIPFLLFITQHVQADCSDLYPVRVAERAVTMFRIVPAHFNPCLDPACGFSLQQSRVWLPKNWGRNFWTNCSSSIWRNLFLKSIELRDLNPRLPLTLSTHVINPLTLHPRLFFTQLSPNLVLVNFHPIIWEGEDWRVPPPGHITLWRLSLLENGPGLYGTILLAAGISNGDTMEPHKRKMKRKEYTHALVQYSLPCFS